MATKLNAQSLAGLPASVGRPAYDRAALRPGILHIGVGNFHRAHQAVYLDDLFNLGLDHDWAIVGAGIKQFDADRRALLEQQDWLSTVVELDPRGLSARVTGPMIDFCPVDGAAIIARIADPDIRIVSLTITEGGYYVDAKTGTFDAAHPEIAGDAANPDAPQTVFGLICAGLRRRRDMGHPALTVLSCDNLPENGHVARNAVLGMAQLLSPDLHNWIDQHVAFPNGMVDCITPATSVRERALVTSEFGIIDAAPVVCEPFRQWVLEDAFPYGRPALEKVGVTFVDDVSPYETMKLSILNAGHAAIAYPSALLGYTYVHDAMADPDIAGWLVHLMRSEVIPVLPSIPGVDYHGYLSSCVERFSNKAVGDTIARLCQDGSNRQPKFVLPTLSAALRQNKPVSTLALEIALWCRYLAMTVDPGSKIAVEDPRAPELITAAVRAQADPLAFLSIESVFGDLSENTTFVTAFAQQLAALEAIGVRDVLRNAAAGDAPTPPVH